MSYRREDGAWFIWWDNAFDIWYISIVLGVSGANGWSRNDPSIEGDYNPYGTAVGVATVTKI